MSWLSYIGMFGIGLLIILVIFWGIWVTDKISDLLDVKEHYRNHLKIFNENVDKDNEFKKRVHKEFKKMKKKLKEE